MGAKLNELFSVREVTADKFIELIESIASMNDIGRYTQYMIPSSLPFLPAVAIMKTSNHKSHLSLQRFPFGMSIQVYSAFCAQRVPVHTV